MGSAPILIHIYIYICMFSDGKNVFEGDELKGRYSILLHFGKYILHEIAMSSYLDCSHDLHQQNMLDFPSAEA